MEIDKVYINGKKTGLIVEGFDIKEDSIYLSVHRKEEEFPELMKEIGNPNKKPTKKILNRFKKIFEKTTWDLGRVYFNFGFVTFELTTPNNINHGKIEELLGLSSELNHPIVIPLMKIEEKLTGFHTWIYTINCRNEYYKEHNGFPETMKVQQVKSGVPDWL